MDSLRALLVQRAARLQGRPALSAPAWGTLSWSAWRSRVEGVALGLLADPPPPVLRPRGGGPWDWACEVAAACCGLRWGPEGQAPDPALLGGPRFNADAGRGPYHELEHQLGAATPFLPGIDHGQLLLRLQRLNRVLGWDHETELELDLAALGSPASRAALWSLLYAGGHARLTPRPRGSAPWPESLAGLLDPTAT